MCKETEVIDVTPVEEAAAATAEAVQEAPSALTEAAEEAAEEAKAAVTEEAAPAETMEDLGEALEESLKKGPVTDDPVWDTFETQFKEKTVFPVKVENTVKAGVVTFVEGVRGFIPASKISTGYVENLEEFVGQTLDVVVVTADRAAKKLVLSARDAIRQKERNARKAALEACQVGDVLEGTVDSLMDYGAFVDLENGVSGLVHVSQISYKRVEKPSDVLEKGQKVKVKIIAIKDGKLSLSMKALTEAPERPERPERGEKSDRPRRERGERRHNDEEVFNYKETGKATTSLGDMLKNIKLS